MAKPSRTVPAVSARDLDIDPPSVTRAIVDALRSTVRDGFRKRGAVVGISGGVDSAVVAALCARAFGPEATFGLFTPERDSSPETLELSRQVAASQGVTGHLEDITDTLVAAGCYRRQDEAVRAVLPEYGPDWKFKIVLPSVVDSDRYRVFSLIARSPDGEEHTRRLTPASYLGLVAATNLKQRTRKMFEYYHGERLNYAVSGTPNRLEYDQGFFVKGGDGQADFKPIAHLYKSQVYQLARHLNVPDAICARPPTTDTYSLSQGQDEFYFSLPYDKMDLCLYAKNRGLGPESVCDALRLTEEQAARVFRDIDAKRRATRYQHICAVLVQPVPEVSSTLPAPDERTR